MSYSFLVDLNKDGVISKDEFLNGMDRENRGEHPDFSEEHHDNTNTYHSNSGSSHNKESLEKHFGTSSYQNIPEKFRIQ